MSPSSQPTKPSLRSQGFTKINPPLHTPLPTPHSTQLAKLLLFVIERHTSAVPVPHTVPCPQQHLSCSPQGPRADQAGQPAGLLLPRQGLLATSTMAKDLMEHIDWQALECLNEQPSHGVANCLKQVILFSLPSLPPLTPRSSSCMMPAPPPCMHAPPTMHACVHACPPHHACMNQSSADRARRRGWGSEGCHTGSGSS